MIESIPDEGKAVLDAMRQREAQSEYEVGRLLPDMTKIEVAMGLGSLLATGLGEFVGESRMFHLSEEGERIARIRSHIPFILKRLREAVLLSDLMRELELCDLDGADLVDLLDSMPEISHMWCGWPGSTRHYVTKRS